MGINYFKLLPYFVASILTIACTQKAAVLIKDLKTFLTCDNEFPDDQTSAGYFTKWEGRVESAEVIPNIYSDGRPLAEISIRGRLIGETILISQDLKPWRFEYEYLIDGTFFGISVYKNDEFLIRQFNQKFEGDPGVVSWGKQFSGGQLIKVCASAYILGGQFDSTIIVSIENDEL